MLFSKSFGYALRGTLYVALHSGEREKIQITEIAERLTIPRHFLGKVMKDLVKNNILVSARGPHGGFSLGPDTLTTPIIQLIEITDGLDQFNHCVLRLKKCNAEQPCPLHYEMSGLRDQARKIFSETTIGDLLQQDKKVFLNSIAIGI